MRKPLKLKNFMPHDKYHEYRSFSAINIRHKGRDVLQLVDLLQRLQ